MNRRNTGDSATDAYQALRKNLPKWGIEVPVRKSASLCCGTGSIERALISNGLLSNCTGYDLSPDAIFRARAAATASGIGNLRYVECDLDQEGLDDNGFDLILAHQAIHHVEALESVFDHVARALKPNGIFHLHEFVGPDRFQWSDRQVEEMTNWLRSLPERYVRTRAGAVKRMSGRATIEEMIAYDPSEAVRSSDIERLLAERFEIIETHALGGTLLMMALADIAQNFDPNNPDDRAHIERLVAREDELIASGELSSDFKVIVARSKRFVQAATEAPTILSP